MSDAEATALSGRTDVEAWPHQIVATSTTSPILEKSNIIRFPESTEDKQADTDAADTLHACVYCKNVFERACDLKSVFDSPHSYV